MVRIQPGETLPDILDTPATAPQVMYFFFVSNPKHHVLKEYLHWHLSFDFVLKELEHTNIVERRAVQDAQTPEGLKSSAAVLEDSQLPLEQKKRKILRNLRNLEQGGLVTASNKYQDLINDISKVH